jgi:hypothetical protein
MKKSFLFIAASAMLFSCTKAAAPPLEPHDSYYRLSMKDKNTQEYVVVETVGVKEYISSANDEDKRPPRCLPVTIEYFEVRASKSVTYIEWKTSYEDNIEYFQIEKSLDGYKWFPVGKQIKPKGIGIYTIQFK